MAEDEKAKCTKCGITLNVKSKVSAKVLCKKCGREWMLAKCQPVLDLREKYKGATWQ